jgi:hypothetical protein
MPHTTPTSRPTAHAAPRPNRQPLYTWLAIAAIAAGVFAATRIPALADTVAKTRNKTTTTPTTPAIADLGKLDAQVLARVIDEKIQAKLQAEHVPASGRCTDAEFIRRAYLDIIGVIPPANRVKTFLASTDPNKRAHLIDELLANPRYGRYFGEIWANAMLPKESNNRRLQTKPLQDWMVTKLNQNTPWDKLVYELLTATGPQDENPAVTFFIGNPTPDKMTDRATQLFLGVQLQCAQCHNHPFTDTKQTEYWGMAAFFMKVRLSANPQQAAKKGVPVSVVENGGIRRGKKNGLPESAKIVPAKFLGEGQPDLNKNQPYRPVLARWLTSKQNHYFARAVANKLWHHFLGRGLVNPVDDMHADNPSTHPELLAVLEQQVKAHDFDLKYLIRAICNSDAYQRSSRPAGKNGDDKELFSHAQVRTLSPEQLYDSLDAVLQNGNLPAGPFNGRAKVNANVKNKANPNAAAKNKANPNAAAKKKVDAKNKKVFAAGRGGLAGQRFQFVNFFSTDDGYQPLDYQAGIPQALRLMNARQINANTGAIARAMKEGTAPGQVIEHLFLEAYARRPTPAERDRFVQYVGQQGDPRSAYGDILWALLNSSEFALNH